MTCKLRNPYFTHALADVKSYPYSKEQRGKKKKKKEKHKRKGNV